MMKISSYKTQEVDDISLDPSLLHDDDEDLDDAETAAGSHNSSNGEDGDDCVRSVQIGEDESKAVDRVRVILMLILLLSATAVSTAVYIYSREKEKEDFRKQFKVHADKIISDITATTARSLRAIEGFSLQITIHAIDHDQVWPNVVLSNFESRARITIGLAEAISLIFIPIVSNVSRAGWEEFSVENQGWLNSDLSRQTSIHDRDEHELIDTLHTIFGEDKDMEIPASIFELTDDGMAIADGVPSLFAPLWQFAPAFPVSTIVNLNTLTIPSLGEGIKALISTEKTIVGKAYDFETHGDVSSAGGRGEVLNLFLNRGWSDSRNYTGGPVSDLYSPIFNTLGSEREMTGLLTSYVYWQVYFEDVLPEEINGIIAILENSCNQTFTFELNGPDATFVGEGDLHETKYDDREVSTGFGGVFLQDIGDSDHEQCLVNIRMYPSTKLENIYLTTTPAIFTGVLLSTFLITSLVFLWYQSLVDSRQKIVMKAAVQSTSFVNALFPANVRQRLFEGNENHLQTRNSSSITNVNRSAIVGVNGSSLTSKLTINQTTLLTSESIFGSKPIADLFPNTTVMFADMVGFTAWASIREPTHVFMLLETVYHSFDVIAKKMRVFKVETVGDCYVAVAGLPSPRKDHAVVMAKFATSCRSRMEILSQDLETLLGPDTAELGLRIGMHSGPVTAGVLRGDKGRFQLFGDTINTASRMESTGQNGRIHLSLETADLLIAANRGKWIARRKEKIVAKGKGEMETFWLVYSPSSSNGASQNYEDLDPTGKKSIVENDNAIKCKTEELPEPSEKVAKKKDNKLAALTPTANDDINTSMNNASSSFFGSISSDSSCRRVEAKTNRSIQWNVEILVRLLKQMVARKSRRRYNNIIDNKKPKNAHKLQINTKPGETVLDEVVDIVALPKFNREAYKKQIDVESIELPEAVIEQLTKFVADVAMAYGDNPFHNFEHASHVTMSVTKLLSRIVNPDLDVTTMNDNERKISSSDQKLAAALHDNTFGITSDPLTQFACVFGALIHDLDHPGVTNAVLVREQQPEAIKYKNKSVAEQKSVDIAWDLLMDEKNEDLRRCIYGTMDELKRFRQLVVNVVMATDIMDKDLGTLRKARWAKAFREGACDNVQEDVNRKATIVIEHLIQASDVAHTMQHWHVYRKWNERLFFEMYHAYKTGRIEKNPAESWYEGEIGFFDFYILPLAKKLETCGVFGVASDEYLNYALANRREWEERGGKIVDSYIESYTKLMDVSCIEST